MFSADVSESETSSSDPVLYDCLKSPVFIQVSIFHLSLHNVQKVHLPEDISELEDVLVRS